MFINAFAVIFVFILGQSNEQTLADYDQKKIAIRGYPHCSAQDEWYLTPQPDTPSCCVASANKSEEQVLLSNFNIKETSKQPITVEGILKINTNHPQFTLLEAETIDSNEKHFPWITLSLFVLGLFFVIGLNHKKD